MEGRSENNGVMHAIVKRLSSQIFLFALAVILAVLGVAATAGEQGNPVIYVVLAIFVAALLAYLVFERGRSRPSAMASDASPPASSAAVSASSLSSRRQSPPFQVKVWTRPRRDAASAGGSRDIGTVPDRDGARYRVGDEIEVCFLASRDCYITLLNIGTSGALTVLFPNRIHPDNFVRADEVHVVPGENYGFRYQLQGPHGVERLKAVATLSPEPVLDTVAATTSPFRTVSGPAAARDVGLVEDRVSALEADAVAEAQWEFVVSPA